jgi:uncharacterized membrane protein
VSSRFPIYRTHGNIFLAFLGLLLTLIVVFIFIGATEIAFQRIGFTRLQVALILLGTFLGSSLNIPLWRVKSWQRIVQMEEVRFFWISYKIPQISVAQVSTLIAVNLGGAVIPTAVSLYILRGHFDQLGYAMLGVALTAIVVHTVARKVPGLGIATPAFVPPLAAALAGYLLTPNAPFVVAYVSGTLGTLIGADLTNLRSIGELGAPVVSIGGAGTFDGVFLSGIIAALLV